MSELGVRDAADFFLARTFQAFSAPDRRGRQAQEYSHTSSNCDYFVDFRAVWPAQSYSPATQRRRGFSGQTKTFDAPCSQGRGFGWASNSDKTAGFGRGGMQGGKKIGGAKKISDLSENCRKKFAERRSFDFFLFRPSDISFYTPSTRVRNPFSANYAKKPSAPPDCG